MRGLGYQTTSGAAARPAGSPWRCTPPSHPRRGRPAPAGVVKSAHTPRPAPTRGPAEAESFPGVTLSGRCPPGASRSGVRTEPRLRPSPRPARRLTPRGPAWRRRREYIPDPSGPDAGWEHQEVGGHRRVRAAQAPRSRPPLPTARGPAPEGLDAALTGQRLLLRRRQQQGPRPPAPFSAAASSSAAATNRPSAPPTDTTAGAAKAATSGHGDG